MNKFIAFTKKELMEQLRTYKLLVMVCVFFLFGMMSPLLAKLMPDIFKGISMEGVTLIIPEPTVIDAYSQFFKNTTQMGIIVILLVFGGVLSNELTKGTLINVLAKGLPRHTVILSKYVAAVILWSISYILAVITCYGYTVYLFESASVSNLVFSLFCLWLFGALVISLIFLSSTIAGGGFGGLILTVVIIGGFFFLNIFPKLENYNPINLVTKNMALLTEQVKVEALTYAVVISIICAVASIILSISIFAKKKL